MAAPSQTRSAYLTRGAPTAAGGDPSDRDVREFRRHEADDP
jgi:hypothetical protein